MSQTSFPDDTDLYVPPQRIPVRDQQEEDPKETEKGESEKKQWPGKK
jgi:hypothetical protein